MIDDEIRKALDVEPSPQFLARVRTRIVAEPAPSAWRWSWTVAAAGAMAAVLLSALIVSRRPETISTGPAPVAQPFKAENRNAGITPTDQRAPALEPAIAEVKRRTASRRSSDAPVRLKPDTTDSAILLLDPAETRALQALIAGVHAGRIELAAAQASAPAAPMELQAVTDIVIAPITIEPIAPLSGAEGVRP